MRTNKFIPFLIALILHIGPLGYFLLHKHSEAPLGNSGVVSTGSQGIDLSSFTFNKRNIRSPRNLAPVKSSTPTQSGSIGNSTTSSAPGTGAGAGLESKHGPHFLAYQEPIYPPVARMKGYTGKVKIKVSYDSEGAVTKVDVLESSGVSMLDEAVKKSTANWRLTKGVAGDFEKSFEFNLRN